MLQLGRTPSQRSFRRRQTEHAEPRARALTGAPVPGRGGDGALMADGRNETAAWRSVSTAMSKKPTMAYGVCAVLSPADRSSELKLRRLTEHNQRLREDLDRQRVRVSDASASYVAPSRAR